MTDIYDIKTFLFSFLLSIDYVLIIFIVVFFVLFYILLNYFFDFKGDIKIETKHITDNKIKLRLEYLIKNSEIFSRNIFYREVSLFIKTLIYNKFQDKSVFFMTLAEIENNFKNEYNTILKEVYYLEFDKNLEDSLILRKKILQKIKV